MKQLDLIFVDAGGGHRSAATALCDVARLEQREWTPRMTNLLDLFAPLDFSRRLTGVPGSDVYNALLRRGWTLGFGAMLTPFHSMIRRSHDRQVELLMQHWKRHRPDAIISFVPHFNRCLHEAAARSAPGVPLITVLTDLADFPPNFWIGAAQPQYFVCGTSRAREQALAAGHPPDRVFETSGMILNPRFYASAGRANRIDRLALGLGPARPTALMMFGGEGSSDMLTIARRLDASGLDVQLIALCGNNAQLERRLRAERLRIPMYVSGFTSEVAALMRLSDFFIGKPGPASISEALTMGLPVIVESNRWTMPQERWNTDWVRQSGLGIAVRSFSRDIAAAVREMIEPTRRRAFAERVGRYRNRAIFELPVIIEQLLAPRSAVRGTRYRPPGRTPHSSAAAQGTARAAHQAPR